MTTPTYPRIDDEFRNHVLMAFGNGFACTSPGQAKLALRALQDAFAAGQRSMIERKDDDRTDA